jgi:cytochrome c
MFKPFACVTSTVLALCAIAPTALHAADSPGQQVFAGCAACHSTDGTPGVGPTLQGILGRRSGSVPGFPYSSAMKRAQLQWTNEELDKYLANPQAVVPGNVMPFAGMADANQRSMLVAYLARLK